MRETILYYTEAFLDHKCAGHPERPERLTACLEYLKSAGRLAGIEVAAPEGAKVEDIARVHFPTVIDLARETAAAGGGWLDADTFVSAGSYEAALLAAGAAMQASLGVLEGRRRGAMALVRPPGHHATPSRSMGFCLFNNIAVAARGLLDTGRASRLAIVDFDAHHGNGTEQVAREDERLLFVSFHRHPFYPGTGAAAESGGNIVNTPLGYDTAPGAYLELWGRALETHVEPFGPEMILVSAGFDGYKYDPLGGLGLEVEDYRAIGALIRASAERTCGGKVASTLEGGYDLDGLPRCLEAYLGGLGFF